MCDMETIVDWQQRGVNARILGLSPDQNPLLKHRPERGDRTMDDWRQKMDAWSFGWEIEDAARRA